MADLQFSEFRLEFTSDNVVVPFDGLVKACKDNHVTSVCLDGLSGLKPALFLDCPDVQRFDATRCDHGFDLTGVSQALSVGRSFDFLKFFQCSMTRDGLLELARIKGRVTELSLRNLNLASDVSPCDFAGVFAIPGLTTLSIRYPYFRHLVDVCYSTPEAEDFVRCVRETKVERLAISGCGAAITALVAKGLAGNSSIRYLETDSVELLPSLLAALKGGNKTLCSVDGLSYYQLSRRPSLARVFDHIDPLLRANEKFRDAKRAAKKQAAREMAALVWCWKNTPTSEVNAPATLADIPVDLLATHVMQFTLELPVHPLDQRVEEPNDADSDTSDAPPRKKQRLSGSDSD